MKNEEELMNLSEGNIVEATAKTIVKYNLDTAFDITEIGIDSLIAKEFFRSLPLIKMAYGLLKTGFAVREKHLVKKTLLFINQLNCRGISSKYYHDYKKKLKNNDKKIMKELQYVLIIIDRYVEANKNIILGNLYFSYVEQKIDWEQFQELSIIVDNIFLKDFSELENIYTRQLLTMNDIIDKNSFRRLKVQNLVEDVESILRMPDGGITHFYNENDYEITLLGNLLYKYGLNK